MAMLGTCSLTHIYWVTLLPCFTSPLPYWCFLGLPPRSVTFIQILISRCPSGDTNEDSYKIRNESGRGANSNWSLLLPHSGDFEGGVPYQITVTAVSPWGLAPAPSVWKFREELGKWWGWRMEGPGTLAELDPLTFSHQYPWQGQCFGDSRIAPQGPLL